MLLLKKKGDESTIRKVCNDDKTEFLGVVGTFKDLMNIGLVENLTQYSTDTWCCIPTPGRIECWDGIGATRKEAIEKCVFGKKIGS